MKHPNLNEEKKLWTPTHPPPSHRKRWAPKGYKRVACLDESGRGPLAGPVVAAAVVIKLKVKSKKAKVQVKSKKINNLAIKQFSNLPIRDSKKLSSSKREELFRILRESNLIEWGIGRVSEKVIDKINILEATKLAMIRAIKNLNYKLQIANLGEIDYLILDGNFKLDIEIPQKSIVKADEKVFSCAASSIIAKVRRDRIMQKYHKKYPQYGFDKHKGYPTKYHVKMLKKYGPCQIHRKSFKPVAKYLI
jgi:ribonuclease HII